MRVDYVRWLKIHGNVGLIIFLACVGREEDTYAHNCTYTSLQGFIPGGLAPGSHQAGDAWAEGVKRLPRNSHSSRAPQPPR
jgi:hypothetical protein